jgi:hypothetical protein
MWWRVALIAGFGLILFAGAWSGLKQMQLED